MAFPKIEGYVVTEKLGSGSYSTVYKAYNKGGPRRWVAVKCVSRAVCGASAAADGLVAEIRLLKTLRHPHIVTMHDFTWDTVNIYIMMEVCNGGDLCALIRRRGRLREAHARYLVQQLVSALKYLHEKGVSHGDLKPHNLLLHYTARCYLKLADFGFASDGEAAAARGGGAFGSPLYMAPEARRGPAADMWSLGVVLYECLFGAAPYASSTLAELVKKIQRQDPIRIPPNSSISPECRSLLRSLLQHDPARRLTHEELVAHPYLDLEHMPTDGTYDQGMSSVSRADALHREGQYSRALDEYRAGLALLCPHAAGGGGGARVVTQYMERAERLKQYIKDNDLKSSDASKHCEGETSGATGRALVDQAVPVTPVTLDPVTPATVTPEGSQLKQHSTDPPQDIQTHKPTDTCRIT